MASKILNYILVVIVLILVSGCASRKQCERRYPPQIQRYDSIIRDTVQIIRDSIIKIEPDRAYLKAWIECDKNGELLMKRIEEYEAGKKTTPKIVVRDNYIEIECLVDSAAIAVHWIETHTNAENNTGKTTTIEVNKLKQYQIVLIWAGGAALIFLFILLIIWAIKKYIKLQIPFLK